MRAVTAFNGDYTPPTKPEEIIPTVTPTSAKSALTGDYSKEWKDDNVHGQGTFKNADGNEYSGEWKHDHPYGQDTEKTANGDVYSGQWKGGN